MKYFRPSNEHSAPEAIEIMRSLAWRNTGSGASIYGKEIEELLERLKNAQSVTGQASGLPAQLAVAMMNTVGRKPVPSVSRHLYVAFTTAETSEAWPIWVGADRGVPVAESWEEFEQRRPSNAGAMAIA